MEMDTRIDKCLICRRDNASAFPSTSNKDEDDERDTDQGQAFATLLKLLTMTSGRDTSIQNDDLSTFWDLVSDKSFLFCQSCLQIMSTLATLQNVLERTIRSIEANLGLIQMSIASSTEGTEALLDSDVFRREEMLRKKILGSKLLFKTEKYGGVYFPKIYSQSVGIQTNNDICGPEEEVEIKVEDFNDYPVDDHFEDSENVPFTIFDGSSNTFQESLQQEDSDAQNEEMSTSCVRFHSAGVDDDDCEAKNLNLKSPSKLGKKIKDRNSGAYKSKTTGPKRHKRKSIKLKDPANPDDTEDFGETVYNSKRSRTWSTLENDLMIRWGLDKLPQPKLILKDCKAVCVSEDSPIQAKKRKSRQQQLKFKKVVSVKEEDVASQQPQQSLSSILDIDIDDIKNNVRRSMPSERRISMDDEKEGQSGCEEFENVEQDSDFEPGADVPNSSLDTDFNSSQSDSEFEPNERKRSPKTTKRKTKACSSTPKRKHMERKITKNRVWQRRRVIIRDGKLTFRNREFQEKNEHLYCCFETCDFCIPKIEALKQCGRQMLEHIKIVHLVDSRYQCKQCEMNFSTIEEYHEHVTAEHHHDNGFLGNGRTRRADSKEECEICRKPLRPAGLEKHKWTHKSEAEKEAWIASGKIDPSKYTREKYSEMKIARRFQCETCGKRFPHKAQLQSHEVVHIEFSMRKKIICESCGEIFTTKRGFEIHHLRKHKPDSLSTKWKYCKICDKKFLVKTHYNIHMMSCHGVEKIHSCDKCDKKFADKAGLKNHLVSHLPDDYRPFKCQYCEEAYRYRKNLNRHIRSRHKDKGYEVPLEYRKYITNRLESKPVMTCKQMYPCEICEKYFPMPSRLKKHLITSHSEGGSKKLIKRKPKKNTSKKKKWKGGSSSSERDDTADHDNCNDIKGDVKEDIIITGDLESVNSQDGFNPDLLENELSFLVQEGEFKG